VPVRMTGSNFAEWLVGPYQVTVGVKTSAEKLAFGLRAAMERASRPLPFGSSTSIRTPSTSLCAQCWCRASRQPHPPYAASFPSSAPSPRWAKDDLISSPLKERSRAAH
jgi:hypothetical protein